MKKTIYFVRHGQTIGNVENRYQPADLSLSEEGRRQAHFMGERFAKIPLDLIIASDMARAAETAEEIALVSGKDILFSPLFREVKRPSELVGELRESPHSIEVLKAIKEHETDAAWHHSDEENFHDLKKRGLEALGFLVDRPEERIAVVTHSVFLYMLFGLMMFGEEFDPALYYKVYSFIRIYNTGITLAEYAAGRWQLISWNDHAHLGDAHRVMLPAHRRARKQEV